MEPVALDPSATAPAATPAATPATARVPPELVAAAVAAAEADVKAPAAAVAPKQKRTPKPRKVRRRRALPERHWLTAWARAPDGETRDVSVVLRRELGYGTFSCAYLADFRVLDPPPAAEALTETADSSSDSASDSTPTAPDDAVRRRFETRAGPLVAGETYRLVVKAGNPDYVESADDHCVVQSNLRTEARALRRVRGAPNVVALFDHVTCPDLNERWLVMERMDCDLQVWLAAREPSGYYVADAEVRHLARGIVDGVCALHAARVLHTDVKPANVLLKRDASARHPVVKLCDLGSALLDPVVPVAPGSREVTTVTYRAPELCLFAPFDYGADVWSLACVLLELGARNWLGWRNLEEGADVLAFIIAHIGRPTEQDWPGHAALPRWHPAFSEIKKHGMTVVFGRAGPGSWFSSHALPVLLEHALVYPARRVSAEKLRALLFDPRIDFVRPCELDV